MAHMTLKSVLAGIAFAGLLAATALPNSANASSRKDSNTHPLVIIDHLGAGRSDAALGYKTHWECEIDLSAPTSPETCYRIVGANAPRPDAVGSTTTVPLAHRLGLRFGYTSLGLAHHAASGTPSEGPCVDSGGLRLYETINYGGACIKFTNHGNIDLQTVNFWGTGTNVGGNVSSLSTYGSGATGHFNCINGDAVYFQPYQDTPQFDSNCNDNGHALYM